MNLLRTAALAWLIAPVAMAAGAKAGAKAGANLQGERLYATCAGCHGTAGAGSGNVLPVLAGQPKDALAASLRAFKAGTRPATIMHQISKGYSEEQIEQIAAYLAAQKPQERK